MPKFTFFCCYLLRDELYLKNVKENFVGNLISYKKGPYDVIAIINIF